MTRRMKTGLLLTTWVMLCGFGSVERFFAPNAKIWPRWEKHQPNSRDHIDHSNWDQLLSRHVRENDRGVNLVDYRGFSPSDKEKLSSYIAELSVIQVSNLNRNEQLAYWINLYNALTVQVVLTHFPVRSIRKIRTSPGLFAIGPWGEKIVTVEGNKLSLNDIEHRILRPIWRDPRIHYVLNCASIGCPNLRASAYRPLGLDALLDGAAVAYVNSHRGVSIAKGKVSVSKIYDWFIEDFGGTEKSVLRHLQEYAKPDLAAKLKSAGKLSGAHYDWSLNAQVPD
jgi:hypothetical protein